MKKMRGKDLSACCLRVLTKIYPYPKIQNKYKKWMKKEVYGVVKEKHWAYNILRKNPSKENKDIGDERGN